MKKIISNLFVYIRWINSIRFFQEILLIIVITEYFGILFWLCAHLLNPRIQIRSPDIFELFILSALISGTVFDLLIIKFQKWSLHLNSRLKMVVWLIIFIVAAMISGFTGFFGAVTSSTIISQVLFYLFVALSLFTLFTMIYTHYQNR